MPPEDLLTRLTRLESRLAHAEHDLRTLLRYTGLHPHPFPPTTPSRPQTRHASPATPTHCHPDHRPPQGLPHLQSHPHQHFPSPPPPCPSVPSVVRFSPSLESKLGKTLTGYLGALTLVLGVAFFLKYAWQHNWIHPSPLSRVLTGICSGAALVALGEHLLLRRPMRGFASTLYAAGLATTHDLLLRRRRLLQPPVLPQTPAALLVLATAAAGIALSLRADAPAVAILSLLGAYLSPAVLHSSVDQSASFVSYLLLLSASSWTLSFLRPRWTALRAFTFAANWLWYALWYSTQGHHHPDLAFAFVSLTFAGTLAELYLSTQCAHLSTTPAPRRSAAAGLLSNLQSEILSLSPSPGPLGEGRGEGSAPSPSYPQNALAFPRDAGVSPAPPPPPIDSSCAVLSLLNTLLTATALYLLHSANQPLAGTLALGLAAIQSVVALSTFSRPMRYSAILQSTALITLAVPLLASHFTINLTWLVMGVTQPSGLRCSPGCLRLRPRRPRHPHRYVRPHRHLGLRPRHHPRRPRLAHPHPPPLPPRRSPQLPPPRLDPHRRPRLQMVPLRQPPPRLLRLHQPRLRPPPPLPQPPHPLRPPPRRRHLLPLPHRAQ